MHAARILANYVRACPKEILTPITEDKVLCCMLDLITATLAGYDTAGAIAVRRAAPALFGPGEAAVWFSGGCLNWTGAAFCNAAAASALDLDDGHRSARGHPGAAIIPAVLSIAANRSADRDEILMATALGYEIGVRVAAAQNPNAIKSRQSGRWVGYGVVAAAGRLCKTPVTQLSHAFSIAGVLSPNQDANGSSGYSQFTGNDVKEGIAWGTVTGLTALRLAEAGYTGPEDILDHASHFDTCAIVANLARPSAIESTYFKPYACCRYIHPAIDALNDLVSQLGIATEQIDKIIVQTFDWTTRLGNRIDPQNLTDIQYSLPYCMAIAAVDGAQALAPIGAHHLDRADLRGFAKRVSLTIDDEIDRRFPAETLARVTIVDRAGERFTSPITTPRGDIGRPMLWADVCQKFRTISATRLAVDRQQALLAAFEVFRQGDTSQLVAWLREPLTS